MANKCTSCQKKFSILKINRAKCMECDQGFCIQCIKKGNGLRFYCNICFILNSRPVNRSILMNIRAKDVKHYLERRDVKTNCCIEKEDLVNKFIWYVDIEAQIPKGKNKNNILNGFMNTLTSSMPNLLDQNFSKMFSGSEGPSQSPTNPSTDQATASSSSTRIPNPYPAYSSQQNVPQNNAAQPEPSAPPEPVTSTNNTTQYAAQSTSNDNSKSTVRKLIRLSDIANVEDIQHLSPKQLKELLFINRIDFKGCVEKEELVKKAVNLWTASRNEQEPEDMSGEDLCKICMDAPLNSVLLECGHIATCIDCGKQLAECPICRQYIVRVVHTFKA